MSYISADILWFAFCAGLVFVAIERDPFRNAFPTSYLWNRTLCIIYEFVFMSWTCHSRNYHAVVSYACRVYVLSLFSRAT
jgi:hypothetical protein